MRAISATLRAAATRWGGRPVITAEVQDRRLRWTALRQEGGATMPTDLAVWGGGPMDAGLHRVAVDEAGHVLYCRVSNPAAAASWTAWDIIAVGATPRGDVALAVADDTLGALRIAYAAPDGAGGHAVRSLESADGGAHWVVGAVVVAGLSQSPWVAADGTRVFYTRDGRVAERAAPPGGAWGSEGIWSAAGPYATFRGIGAALDRAEGRYHVVVAADGKVRVGALDDATGVWPAPRAIAPGGEAPVTSDSLVSEPAIEVAAERRFVTWLDRFDGSPAWAHPVVAASRDDVHYGEEVALGCDAEVDRRVALAYDPIGDVLYAANERCVTRHCPYDAALPSQHLEGLTPLRYRRRTTEAGSRLRIELANPGGAYDSLGREGALGEAVRPLASVVVARGYATPAGAEVVALDPHYIVATRIVQGMRTHPGGGEVGRAIIDAVDGWGLLSLWHPSETLSWREASIGWLMTEMCARVGLRFVPEDDAFARVAPVLTVPTSATAADVCRRLLRLIGGIARFDAEGAMHGLRLVGHAPTPADVGLCGEISFGAYGSNLGRGTSFRVYGDPYAGANTASEAPSLSMRLGMRIHVHYEDYGLADAAMARAARDGLWLRAHMAQRLERVTAPLRPELELWDWVRLFPSGSVFLPIDRERRLVGIAEEWDAVRRRYASRLTLAAV